MALYAGIAWALQACAQPPQPPHSHAPGPSSDEKAACQASAAAFAVGQEALPSLVETARRQAGAESVRVVRHDEITTREYMVGRLNLRLGPDGRVAEVDCG